jgi:alanine racemase
MMGEARHLSRAHIHLDRLTHNLRLLQKLVGTRPMWPAIKANGYGHGMELVASHLLKSGYDTICVAHVSEAVTLIDAGLHANYLLLSATLPEHSEAIVAYGCEPAVCTMEMVESLAIEAEKADRQISVHLMVDTGMGRIGVTPSEAQSFLRQFQDLAALARSCGIETCHLANSAGILDLPDSHFDAVRPGIAMYGLRPSREIANPLVNELKPVLEWKTQITMLKEVASGVGLSYGHSFHTTQPSLIATIPLGYGDGLNRNLSNRFEVLVGGLRCPQVGRITMDQSLLDVTRLRGKVGLGNEVVIIGRQGEAEISADELADKLGTINYEIVTAITHRVARIEETNQGT